MKIGHYTENERAMLLALVQSPIYAILKKIVDEDRQECLARLTTETNANEIFRLQGRLQGNQTLMNAPKLLAQFEIEEKAKQDRKKRKNGRP